MLLTVVIVNPVEAIIRRRSLSSAPRNLSLLLGDFKFSDFFVQIFQKSFEVLAASIAFRCTEVDVGIFFAALTFKLH